MIILEAYSMSMIISHYTDDVISVLVVSVVNGNGPEMFDAFISFSDKDAFFVKEMIRMLEDVSDLHQL